MRLLKLAVPCILFAALAASGDDVSVLVEPSAHHDMLRTWLTKIAKEQLTQRETEVGHIHSVPDFEKRRQIVHAKLMAMIGALPSAKTPLNVQRLGTLDRGDYKIEKIVYESLPKFYVTANLYVPKSGKGPYPAVLQSLGHSVTAKSRDIYQSIAISLVQNGYIVLNYDPLGQGERRIFWDQELGDSKVGGSVNEHEMVGMGSLLMGESIARYMIWDGIRGIDLLQSLPNVDSQRIGIAGCSGGGTITAYLAVFDKRVKAVADACYITSWENQLDGTGPQDAEQQFPGLIAQGLDHADLVEQFAPKPYLIVSTTDDFFPIAGARRSYEEAKRIYGLFGAADRVGWFVAPGGHGVRLPSREAIDAWMNRYLKVQPGPTPSERPFVVEFDSDLNCTRTGQVATSLGGETASTLKIEMAKELDAKRKPDANLRDAVLKLTRFEKPSGELSIETGGTFGRPGYDIERLVYESRPGLKVPALLFVPHQRAREKRPIIFADSRGKAADSAEGGDLDQLAKSGFTVLAIDPVGIGETKSSWGGYSDYWFGESKTAWLALMVSKPLIGLRMEDIVRGIDVLQARGLASDGVTGFSKGSIGVAMLHAAVVDDRLQALAIEGSLASYALIAETPLQRHIHDLVLPDVLHHYDLPDLVGVLGSRQAHLVNLKDAMWNPLPLEEARKIYHGSKNVTERREFDPMSRAYPELGF